MIGKLETWKQDATFVGIKMGLDKVTSFDPTQVWNPSTLQEEGDQINPRNSTVYQLMATLTKNQLAKVKEFYQHDFKMFGYNKNKYLT